MPDLKAARPRRPKVGLVLGSGGSRGIVHVEILENLPRLGVPLDLIVGSSIGAVAAGIYAAGGLPLLRKDLRTMKREDFFKLFDPSLSRYGFFTGRKAIVFLRRYIPAETRIEDLSVPLGIVATDFDSGRPVVFRKGNLLEAIRASISIPGVFTPVRIGKKLLLDGGVASPLPIDIAEQMGAHLVVAVSLQPAIGKLRRIFPTGWKRTKPADGEAAEKIPIMEKFVHRISAGRSEERRWLKIADQWLTSNRSGAGAKPKTPNLIDIVTRTIDIMAYTETLQMLAAHPPAVLFEFDFPELGVLDFTKSEALLAESRRIFELKKPELIANVLDRLSLPMPPSFLKDRREIR
ncbi:MAG: patatin-like phospholipase family protein [Candidatus Aminicenantes bacterium]|nr:patatin-like phospholipase family protein [Candidatus Aminicenantes bacterium]